MEENQWKKIADDAPEIQDMRNRVFNEKCLSILDRYIDGNKVFDYGCGWGEFANLLKEKGYAVEAYDDADEMVDQARKHFSGINFMYKQDFLNDISELTDKYDAVTSNLVLCILEKDKQDELIENMEKVVKPGGLLLISMCHPAFDFLTYGLVTKRITPYAIAPKYTDEFKYRKSIHENHAEFDDYHRPLEYFFSLFKEHGLRIIDMAESETLKTSMYPDFLTVALRAES
jgi:2-polyprenyl-3-methyl-5-hydroxy-6-metoxy-1,4-benzoquinol methylase